MINGTTLILKQVNFPFLDGYVLRSRYYGEYISQLIPFARVCPHVKDFNKRNNFLTSKLQVTKTRLAPL